MMGQRSAGPPVRRYAGTPSDDAVAWAAVPETRIVLLTMRAVADWAILGEVCRGAAGNGVIVLLDQPSLPAYIRALEAGAIAVLPRDAPPDALREVFETAANGKSVVPTDVLRALLRPDPEKGADYRGWSRIRAPFDFGVVQRFSQIEVDEPPFDTSAVTA